MKAYHFNFGNSYDTGVGATAVVVAHTPENALQRLRELLPGEVEVPLDGVLREGEYLTLYFNESGITEADITASWVVVRN